MAKMSAIQVTKAGAPVRAVEGNMPEAGDDQVRIKVEACGICHSDAFVKGGGFPGLVLPAFRATKSWGKVRRRR